MGLPQTGLTLRGVLKMPRSDAFKRKKLNGCPNEFCPSDHLSLVADFDWHSHRDRDSDLASPTKDLDGNRSAFKI